LVENIVKKEINKNYKWTVLSCTTLGTLLMSLSGTMMFVALPVITIDLNTSMEQVAWTLIINGYSICAVHRTRGRHVWP